MKLSEVMQPRQLKLSDVIGDSSATQPKRKSVFQNISPEQQVEHPYLAATAKTAQDVFTIPAHFANQFLLDYPRRITEKFGYEYPSETDNPVAGIAAKTAGVIGGIKNPIVKALGGGIGAKLGKNMLAGAVTGAAYSPSKFESPGQVIGEQVQKSIVGAALPLAGKAIKPALNVIPKATRFISKNIGGITDATVETIKRLGPKRVFEPIKANADYISQNLAPRVYKQLKSVIDFADNAYKNAMASAPEGKKINIRPAIEQAGNQLKQLGLITEKGNLTELGNSEIARDSVYGKLLDFYKSSDAISGVGKLRGKDLTQSQMIKAFGAGRETLVNKDQYTFLRDKLNSLYKNKPSDIDVNKVADKFYQSGEDSGIKGLQLARKLKREAFNIEDKVDVNKISRDFIKAKNPQWTKQVEGEYKKILGEKGFREVWDDLMAHFANKDFSLISDTPGTGGGIFAGRSGLTRAGVSEATKKYYQKVYPTAKKIGENVGNIGKFGVKRINQIMEEPYFSPKIRGKLK